MLFLKFFSLDLDDFADIYKLTFALLFLESILLLCPLLKPKVSNASRCTEVIFFPPFDYLDQEEMRKTSSDRFIFNFSI